MVTGQCSLHKECVVPAAIAVFLVALICRLAFLYYFEHNNVSYALKSDYHSFIAENLVTGKGYSAIGSLYQDDELRHTAPRIPIYPTFLSAIYITRLGRLTEAISSMTCQCNLLIVIPARC